MLILYLEYFWFQTNFRDTYEIGMRPNGVRRDFTVSYILYTSITINVSRYEPVVFFDKILFPP